MKNPTSLPVALADAKQSFALALNDASSLDIVNNMAAAFDGAIIINRLEAVLTDDIMQQVFMPLMNKKIGFLTDRDPNRPDKRTGVAPKPYPISVVRTAIIDAAMMGLQPMGNQFNIISGTMYPAKAGYTALLGKLKQTQGLVYNFEFDPETAVKSADPSYVAIPCRISYRTNRDDLKGYFKYVAMVKSNGETSTTDQLRGKAERKCKKAFVEFLTGLDLGDGDPETVDISYTEVHPTSVGTTSSSPDKPLSASDRARQILNRSKATEETPTTPTATPTSPTATPTSPTTPTATPTIPTATPTEPPTAPLPIQSNIRIAPTISDSLFNQEGGVQ